MIGTASYGNNDRLTAPITARITDSTGIHYKHYSQEAGGIDKAMQELYPLLDDGIINSLTFIEKKEN